MISNNNNKDQKKQETDTIVNRNNIISKYSNSNKNKTFEKKMEQKFINSKINTNNNITISSKQNTYNNKTETLNKNIKSNNSQENRSYKTSTYNASNKDNLNNERTGTSIIITSSKVNEGNNDPSIKGKIHHMVTFISAKDNRTNSNSKYKDVDITGKHSLNISNEKNRTITIISSNQDIEIGKEGDKNKINKHESKSNNKSSNISKGEITNFSSTNNYLNNNYSKREYTRIESDRKTKNIPIINLRKNEIKNRGINYISSISNKNQVNEKKLNESNENDKFFNTNTSRIDNQYKNKYKFDTPHSANSLNKTFNKDNNNLNKSIGNNSEDSHKLITNSNKINNTVFMSSYTTKGEKDNKFEEKNTNTKFTNTINYKLTNLAINRAGIKQESKTNNKIKEKKNNSKDDNSINNQINNKAYNNISNFNSININSQKYKEEKNDINNNDSKVNQIQSNLTKKPGNLSNYEANTIEKDLITILEKKANININTNIEEETKNFDNQIDTNNIEEKNDNIKPERDVFNNKNYEFNNQNIFKKIEKEYDFLKIASKQNNIFDNLSSFSSGQSGQLYDKYDFLNTPGLSDVTKAYLASQVTTLRPELNIYTKAYLNSLENEDNTTKPELTKLTKDYLSKNFIQNDKKESDKY